MNVSIVTSEQQPDREAVNTLNPTPLYLQPFLLGLEVNRARESPVIKGHYARNTWRCFHRLPFLVP